MTDRVVELNDKVRELHNEQRQKEWELDSYRSRLSDLSMKKPGLIELKVNRATMNVLKDFEEATLEDQ
jgi:hypothetical protein